MDFRLVITRQNTDAPLAEHLCVEPIISIGSDPAATIYLNGSGVAAEQVVILREDESLLLINRAEGTRLNDKPLNREARHPLGPGDTLGFAAYLITLQTNAAASDSTAAAMTQLVSYAEITGEVQAPAEPIRETKNFAAILDSLRTEEDSFYFLFETGAQTGARLLVDKTEMLGGWDAGGAHFSVDPALIEVQRLIIRKDWTGVVVHAPAGAAALRVNDDLISEARRLRNGDRLKIAAPAGGAPIILVFHEPASLIALDTLLPQPLPPPVSAARPAAADLNAPAALPSGPSKKARRQLDWEHRYFGYFNLLELCIMAAGTLAAAVIIFLVLQYA